MRALAVAIGLLAFAASTADAKPKRAAKPAKVAKVAKVAKIAKVEKSAKRDTKSSKKSKKRTALAARDSKFDFKGKIHGQSVGAPWSGRLRDATELPKGDGYVLRRPWRAYGTKSMVEAIYHVVGRVHEQFPDMHVLAIGDLSAKDGGRISEHNSHQSGRDVDIGLVYYKKPAGYPDSFIVATDDNLDCEATFALVEEFAKTGRVQMMFLDFRVQGMLYDWAKANDVGDEHLRELFQFPHGRGSSEGMVRHEPNHQDHIHVRFRCPAGDTACR
ncbi:MAG TPA: penicillin-insensitive murein endopeptidase [Kofleriaceae bacterium]|nr:penicillin-insensitive murein endopeptidase [Kofleriaceae bacterium]